MSITSWWIAHRDKAPRLFSEEVERAFALIREAPLIGTRVTARRGTARRVLLKGSGYHVYYRVDSARQNVEILLFWHTSRGKLPRL
jgi:plasmid stabilization system protein ParE